MYSSTWSGKCTQPRAVSSSSSYTAGSGATYSCKKETQSGFADAEAQNERGNAEVQRQRAVSVLGVDEVALRTLFAGVKCPVPLSIDL